MTPTEKVFFEKAATNEVVANREPKRTRDLVPLLLGILAASSLVLAGVIFLTARQSNAETNEIINRELPKVSALHRSPFFRKPNETDAAFSARMNILTQPPLNRGQWRDAEYAEILREHNESMKALQEEYRKEKDAEK